MEVGEFVDREDFGPRPRCIGYGDCLPVSHRVEGR